MILTDSSSSIGSRENNWVVSLRMISTEEDEADPFDDFFFVSGFEDLDHFRRFGSHCR